MEDKILMKILKKYDCDVENRPRPNLILAINEYASLQKAQARKEAIQECIDSIDKYHESLPKAKNDSDNGYSLGLANAINTLEKLR
jgi:hypothetical protein